MTLIAAPVLLVAAAWLALCVAYITLALEATSDTPTRVGGRVVWVVLRVPAPLVDVAPMTPPTHPHMLRAAAVVEPKTHRPMETAHTIGQEVDRVAA